MRACMPLFLLTIVVLLAACAFPTLPETPSPTTTAFRTLPPILYPTSSPTVTTIPSPTIWYTPSPLPPLPVFATPDSVHMQRWKEYQEALARVLKRSTPPGRKVLCEWIILGTSKDAIYVWALCAEQERNDFYPGVSTPAAIYVDSTGGVVRVIAPELERIPIRDIFPENVAEIIFDAYGGPGAPGWLDGGFEQLKAHLIYRFDHPDVPPLVVLSAIPAP